MATKKLPIGDQVLKLLGDGLGDEEVAEKVGTTPNHVWLFARHPGSGRCRSGSWRSPARSSNGSGTKRPAEP